MKLMERPLECDFLQKLILNYTGFYCYMFRICLAFMEHPLYCDVCTEIQFNFLSYTVHYYRVVKYVLNSTMPVVVVCYLTTLPFAKIT
jgi:hypothetical protein